MGKPFPCPAMVSPLVKANKVKKVTKAFKRHQSDKFIRVPTSWGKPRGIDSRVRRRFRSNGVVEVKVGYGTDKKTKHTLPDGFYKFTVRNVKELEVLMMSNRKYAAEVAKGVSTRKRKEIVERALQLNIKVINSEARLRSEE